MSRGALAVVAWLTIVLLVSGMYRIGEPLNHQHATPGWVLLTTGMMIVPLLGGYALGRVDAEYMRRREQP